MIVAPFAHLLIYVLLMITVLDLTALAFCSYQTPISAMYCRNGHDETGGPTV